ncbi:MAG: metallophosphoesterase family protein [Bacteroidota bacterium]
MGIPASNIICTGDIVGYCAEPEEVVQMVRDWGIHNIAGNVEIQLREGGEDCGCDFAEDGRCASFSANWYPFAQRALAENSIRWMDTLPDVLRFQYCGQNFGVVHGSADYTSRYVFASTPWPEKIAEMQRLDVDVILAGHCGLPFSQQKGPNAWLNPGVIGMPANDGTTRVWYMHLKPEAEGFRYTHHAYAYDFDETQILMLEKGLPRPYIRTLESGLWDNNEILPDMEILFQGVKIELDGESGLVKSQPA